jgi:multiple sugar transport system substrate-binding protein
VRRALPVVLAAAVLVAASACAGGRSGDDGGRVSLNWYVFTEPSGAFAEAVARCNEQAAGAWQIEIVDLPTNADQQRELVVRRLAAEDSDIDIIGMDVIWTAEFAEAEWILPWQGQNAQAASEGALEGPLQTATYENTLYAAPFTSNVQLLWYRTDRVAEPPETWDQMLAMAQEIGPNGHIQIQGARYEGLVVWFNTLVNSAGGSIVGEDGEIQLGEPAVRAAATMHDLAISPAADPALSNAREDNARLAFESGTSSFQLNWPYVYASAKDGAEASSQVRAVFENMGWARYPSMQAGEPSHVTLGGINLGIGAYSPNPDQAFEAALCLRQPENQLVAASRGGLPPTSEALYDDPELVEAYPMADVLRESIADGVPRPVSPAYIDISLAIQDTLHPPRAIDPDETIETLNDRLDEVGKGGLY